MAGILPETAISATDLSPGFSAPSSGGEAAPIGLASPLAVVRDPFAKELDNPAVRERLLRLTEAEVGGQGTDAATAFLETVFNRAAARGQTLQHAMNDTAYYPRVSILGKTPTARGTYGTALDNVLSGSNLSQFATGNASGTVGFAGGPQTYAPGTGERFGIEGPDRPWAADLAANTGSTWQRPVGQSFTAQGAGAQSTPANGYTVAGLANTSGAATPQPDSLNYGALAPLATQFLFPKGLPATPQMQLPAPPPRPQIDYSGLQRLISAQRTV